MRVRALILSIGIVVPMFAHAASPEGFAPRLLVVEKAGKIAFFLPEIHIGTVTQHDVYFKNIIKRAFAASSILLLERPADPWLDNGYRRRACKLETDAESAIDMALNSTLRNFALRSSPLLQMVTSADEIDSLGRFTRFEMLLVAAIDKDKGNLFAADTVNAPRFNFPPPQSGQLMNEQRRQIGWIEDNGTYFDAYCAMTPNERAVLINREIDILTSTDDVSKSQGRPFRTLNEAADLIDGTYRAALRDIDAMIQLPPTASQHILPVVASYSSDLQEAIPADTWLYNRFLLVERNRAWVTQLPVIMAKERLPFFAIGTAHFIDGPWGPGLPALLREAGFKVSLINDADKLRQVLSQTQSAPPIKLSMPLATSHTHVLALNGGCVENSDETYACIWESGQTRYQVMHMPQSADMEILLLCYARSTLYGPLQTCVTKTTRASKARAADLLYARAAHFRPGIAPALNKPAPDGQ